MTEEDIEPGGNILFCACGADAKVIKKSKVSEEQLENYKDVEDPGESFRNEYARCDAKHVFVITVDENIEKELVK